LFDRLPVGVAGVPRATRLRVARVFAVPRATRLRVARVFAVPRATRLRVARVFAVPRATRLRVARVFAVPRATRLRVARVGWGHPHGHLPRRKKPVARRHRRQALWSREQILFTISTTPRASASPDT